MKCSEFKDSVAAFALDALTEEERSACEAHLAGPGPHDGCEDELRRAYEATALLAAALPEEAPGEHVWSAIERAVEHEAPGSETAPMPAVPKAGTAPRGASSTAGASGGAGRPARFGGRTREGVAWTLAIAASLAGLALLSTWRDDRARIADLEQRLAASGQRHDAAEARLATATTGFEAELASTDGRWRACLDDLKNARLSVEKYDRALRLLGAPQTLLVQLAAQDDVPYRASALLNRDTGEALVLSSAFEPIADKDYQLWLIRGDEKISAGLLTASREATLAEIDPALLRSGAPDAFAVTIEPTGGVPQPTGPIVLLGKVGA